MHNAITVAILLWVGLLVNLIRWNGLRKGKVWLWLSAILILGFASLWYTDIRVEPMNSKYHWYPLSTHDAQLYVLDQEEIKTVRFFELKGKENGNWQASQVQISRNYFGAENVSLIVPPFLSEYSISTH